MKTLKYRTNISAECEEILVPYLSQLDGVKRWQVDTASRDKLLTVEAEDLLNDSLVVSAVEGAGFKIKPADRGEGQERK